MTEDDERILEFIMGHDHPTGELYKAAVAAMPDIASLIDEHFREWVWMEWVDAHDPYVETETDAAEREAWTEKAMMRFWEKLAERDGRLGPPGNC